MAIHRYYWPDTPPYASLLRAVARQWVADGHAVTVLTSQPSYKPELVARDTPSREMVDGVVVRRVSMQPDRSGRGRRLFNFIWFPIAAAFFILRGPKFDVIMCSTVPQVTLGAMVSFAARLRRSRFVYHCMDLHPEIGRLSGEFANPVVYRLLTAIDTATCRRANAVVVLSKDMKRSLERRAPELGDKIMVLNNFELPSYEDAAPHSPLPPTPGRVRIAFTGNLGRFQALDQITQGVLADVPALDRLELVFMGEGAAKADLQRLVAEAPPARRDRVKFLPHGSPADAKALLQDSSHGLVSLTPGVIDFAYPSKTATYLSEGLPLLVSVEPDSELARMVTREGVGHLLPRGQHELVRALAELAVAGPSTPVQRAHARDHWRREFSSDAQLERWSALIRDLEGGAA